MIFKNKRGQQMFGSLFEYTKLILWALGSLMGLIIIVFIVYSATIGTLKPVLINYITTQSTIPIETQTTILSAYNNIPIYIWTSFIIVAVLIIIYLIVLAFKREPDNVY